MMSTVMKKVAKRVLFITVIVCLAQDVSSHLFDFPDGVQYSPACGLQNMTGVWSVNGTLTMTQEKMDKFFNPEVIIETLSREICRISLTSCDTDLDLLVNDTEVCACVGKFDDVYFLYARKLARFEDSKLTLQASIPLKYSWYVDKWTKPIGTLPLIYESREDINGYVIFNEYQKDLFNLSDYLACPSQSYSMTVCVENRLPETMLRISITTPQTELHYDADLRTSVACIEYTHDYEFDFWDNPDKMFYEVTVLYEESAVCPRVGDYSFKIKQNPYCNSEQRCGDLLQKSCAGDNSSSSALAMMPGMQVVMCDTQTDGGGWVFIQRRTSEEVDFDVGWDWYVAGFGTLTGNFWYGLNNINLLCNKLYPCELQVSLTYDGEDYYATYDTFYIGGAVQIYDLVVSGYSGTAGDALTGNNGMFFNTKNTGGQNCAQNHGGGWWVEAGDCGNTFLNGWWYTSSQPVGNMWGALTSGNKDITRTEMKVRGLIQSE